MKALGIVDWTCDKARQKDLAWVSCLNPADYHKFIQKHGKVVEAVQQKTKASNKKSGAQSKDTNSTSNLTGDNDPAEIPLGPGMLRGCTLQKNPYTLRKA